MVNGGINNKLLEEDHCAQEATELLLIPWGSPLTESLSLVRRDRMAVLQDQVIWEELALAGLDE
ncbi:hypothetical protein DSO57_1019538 [Entomophthora muscae]|uniref:Uncharacterized protein n=1 Tax=Entomophthora muscae TaxID=34485 RepID=A0ACC2RIJ3_9FUNG|nr:hypothetical protein DSO57_1019538 [Entomophthora muscae]